MPARRPTQSPSILAWIDGDISPADSPSLPVLDQAYLSGMGAFETIRAEGGVPLFLDAHLDRLTASAACFDLDPPDREAVRQGIEALLHRQDFEEARIRVTISGGIQPDGVPFRFGGATRTTILAFPLGKQVAVPLRLVTAPFWIDCSNPLAGHKCTNYAIHAMAVRHARATEADDALLLDHRGDLIGCATGNIFWVKDGRVFTPDTRCGCRNGVTRERVIRACGRLGIPCVTTHESAASLTDADEIFTTSSIRGLRSVIKLDRNKLRAGHVVKRIRAELKRELRLEIRSATSFRFTSRNESAER